MNSSRNPAKGVLVLPAPGRSVHGLTTGQIKAARTPETNHRGEIIGVFRPRMLGGAIGLGMPSTISTLPPHVLPTRNAPLQTVRPGTRRRSPKPGPRNTVFVGRIPTRRQMISKEQERGLASLRSLYLHGNRKAYFEARFQFLRTNDECRDMVLDMQMNIDGH